MNRHRCHQLGFLDLGSISSVNWILILAHEFFLKFSMIVVACGIACAHQIAPQFHSADDVLVLISPRDRFAGLEV